MEEAWEGLKKSIMGNLKQGRAFFSFFLLIVVFLFDITSPICRVNADECYLGGEDDFRIVVEANKIEECDQAYVTYQEDEFYVLSFHDKRNAEACYKKYHNSSGADAEYVSTARVFSTGLKNYSYLSWGAERIHCDSITDALLSKYGKIEALPEITVGIIDSGIDYTHPHFSNRVVEANYDYVYGDGDAKDENGHGTHVAGVIADVTLPNVRINSYRVADEQGYALVDDIIRAIQQAIDDHVNIINMSLGAELPIGSIEERFFRAVLDKAIQNNILLVAAAGNGDENGFGVDIVHTANMWPACYSPVITVSAIDENSQRATFSNYGNVVDLCAPGVDINSSYIVDDYRIMSGTSMAAPFVVGAAALVLTDEPSMTYEQMVEGLKGITIDLGPEGYDRYYGYGLIDLSKWKVHANIAEAMEIDQNDPIPKSITLEQIKNVTKGVKIHWNKSSNAQGYYIYRKDSKNSYKRIKIVDNIKTNSYVDSKVQNGVTYQYKVLPYYEKKVGACKNQLKITRLKPIKCSSLKKKGRQSVKVYYSQNKKATGYQIQYCCNRTFDKKKTITLNTSKEKAKDINKLKQGKTYYVRVRCFHKKGNIKSYSSWSVLKSIKLKK